MTHLEMIPAIKKHALENYEKDGWDVLVECWDDDEIVHTIKAYEEFHKPVLTLEDGIMACHYFLKIGNDQMVDSWADGGLCTICASPDHERKDCPSPK